MGLFSVSADGLRPELINRHPICLKEMRELHSSYFILYGSKKMRTLLIDVVSSVGVCPLRTERGHELIELSKGQATFHIFITVTQILSQYFYKSLLVFVRSNNNISHHNLNSFESMHSDRTIHNTQIK